MAERIVILHVDDDPEFTELTATFLEREDDRFDVEPATSADDGLERLAEGGVDCVVSDYDMPGTNGIEFLETVRKRYPDLPFILFTGKGSEGVASEAVSAGVTDYVPKMTGTDHYTLLANRIDNVVGQYQAEIVVEQTKQRLSEIAENTNDILWMFSADWDDLHFVNSAYEDIWGRSVDTLDANPRDFLDGVHPDDRAIVERAMERLSAGESVDFECRVNEPEDFGRWVWIRGDPIEDEGGDVVRVSGFARDITDRKQPERESRRLKEEYETVFETARDGIFLVDVVHEDDDIRFEFRRLNPAHEAISGMTTEEIRGKTPREVLGEEVGAKVAANYRRCVEAEEPIAYNEVLEMPARPVHWRTKLGPVMADGDVTQIVGIARDITERKEREEELRTLQEEYEQQYRELFEEAPVMFVVTRNESGVPVIDNCNRKFAETLGYPRDELIDRPLADFYSEGSEWELLEGGGYEQALTGEFVRQERELVKNDGAVITTLLRAAPRRDPDGEIIGTHALFVDISERERANELQRRNERLDEFASIVSHDLRNPLTVADGQLELAREECESEHLEKVGQSLDRMGALIDDLLNLAREGTEIEALETVDLAEITDGCWQTVETADTTLDASLSRSVRADPSRLKQLLENLFRNAIEHSNGTVDVRVGGLDDGFFIEDSGPGIPPDVRDRVFEAGYSDAENGTGFGLSIVNQIVEAHGWDIEIRDGADGGARFEITGVDITRE